MRILALSAGYPPAINAGAEITLHFLLRNLVVHGHSVMVARPSTSIGGKDTYHLDGVEVTRLGRRRDLIDRCADSRTRPDVLISHLVEAPVGWALGSRLRIPVVQLIHNETAFSLKWASSADLAVTNSQWLATKVANPNTVVVHPIVLADDYETAPGGSITLVNLYRGKGSEIFYALAARFPGEQFLGVRGSYGDQVLIDDFDNVEILTNIAFGQMRELVYSRTKVLLVPSRIESYGRVAAEAMCSGIPVIAHPTEGLREALGDAALYADCGELDDWIVALRRLLEFKAWSEHSTRARSRMYALDTGSELERWRQAIVSL